MRIYLDACCLNRPFDDQTQDRIRLETEAIFIILSRIETLSDWEWIGSDILNFEIEQTPDPEKRHRVRLFSAYIHYSIIIKQREIERALLLEALGFYPFDALHLAYAETGKASVFLTTDDRLLSKAKSYSDQFNIRIENPLTWLREVV